MQKIKQAAGVAAVAALAGAGLAGPAAAAAPPPQFIRNVATGACLDQHYDADDQPTTTVYAWGQGPCHTVGNEQWKFESIGGNSYRVVNYRSGWCLSAPNGYGSRIYTEYCVSPTPNKQKWTPSITSYGTNLLVSATSSVAVCLRQGVSTAVWADPCNADDANQRWYWY